MVYNWRSPDSLDRLRRSKLAQVRYREFALAAQPIIEQAICYSCPLADQEALFTRILRGSVHSKNLSISSDEEVHPFFGIGTP
ncbi:hypothetical protein TNIN_420331 [Trichonephila inaurata madagascariensis]|uniref:Uncharacterized protein n=1 Tax=Trichonephila inaurata madagascariensis TaxID=2747483 RepID=A0A8X6WW83_9ARAC|nr:hypothetical protein TNIN_420331 [Trichonephila inaurata madagascariensis]